MFRNHDRAARVEVLRGMEMFAALSDAELARVDAHVSEARVDAGTTLMAQGDPGREALIVVDGVAEVRVDGVIVGSVSSGDLVGETALLDLGPRTATVVALTPMRLYVLDPSEFAWLFSQPEAGRWIASHLAHRLREASQRHEPDRAPFPSR